MTMEISEIKNWNKKWLFLVVILLLFFAGCNNKTKVAEEKSAETPSIISSSKEITGEPVVSKKLPDLIQDRLKGKWFRSDGSYTIDIFSVTKDGKLDAGYFNPNPVNVDKAEWVISENKLFVRVILKDLNYPGSTYALIYNPENDDLAGNYFQAVQGMNYDVIFTRKK